MLKQSGLLYVHTAAIYIICAETYPGTTKRATLVLGCRT